VNGSDGYSRADYKRNALAPPRASPPQQPYSIDYYVEGIQNTAFADFTQFTEPPLRTTTTTNIHRPIQNKQETVDTIHLDAGGNLPPRNTNLTHNNRTSAFEIYRKPSSSQSRNSQKSTSPQQQQQSMGGQIRSDNNNHRQGSTEDSVNYEKRLNSISDNLRQVQFFKNEQQNLPDVLKNLKEQNLLLLSLCNDLSSELLDVQKRKLEFKAKIELSNDGSQPQHQQQQQQQKPVASSVYNLQQNHHHHQTNV
jgi:RalBP1-associated Eps domain-containing protein